MPFCLISYDICDNTRRLRVARILLDYGRRVQYSVFECSLTESALLELLLRLERVIDYGEDSIRCYQLCESCRKKIRIMGKEKGYPIEEEFIVI